MISPKTENLNISEKNFPIIKAQKLTKHFGTIKAVNGLNIDIYKGEIFGFLGPNGAGKSTLIRMLVGLMNPTSGNIQVIDYTLPKDSEKLRDKIGYMTQKFSLYEDLTIKENLEFTAEIFTVPKDHLSYRIEEILEEFNLTSQKNRRPAVLSGGWKQRLALAASMIHKPQILFLDEPTAGVDPGSRRLFWEKLFELAALGTTILVSTHYMDEAVRCHRLCMLKDGIKTIQGTPTDLINSLQGRIIEISGVPIKDITGLLNKHPSILSITQLGSRAHVLLKSNAPKDKKASNEMKIFLESKGFNNPHIIPAEPNLEDVFIANVSGEN